MTADLVEATMGPVRQALSDSGLKASDLNKILLVGGSSRIPAVQEAIKNFTGVEPFKGINPDECVAVGAAIQGGVLGGDVEGILLLDVTPLSLGIETMGGVSTKIIERNTTIPTKKSQIFSTAADNQTSVEVHVLQGEREFAKDNKTLGVFHLDGIMPAPRGVPQIEVTFDIDANGIVHVSAKDLGTQKEQSISITSSTNMSKDDIDKAVKEAAQFEEQDKKRKEEIDVRNEADQMVYQCDKILSENGDKINESDKKDVEDKLNALKEALKATMPMTSRLRKKSLLRASTRFRKKSTSRLLRLSRQQAVLSRTRVPAHRAMLPVRTAITRQITPTLRTIPTRNNHFYPLSLLPFFGEKAVMCYFKYTINSGADGATE